MKIETLGHKNKQPIEEQKTIIKCISNTHKLIIKINFKMEKVSE